MPKIILFISTLFFSFISGTAWMNVVNQPHTGTWTDAGNWTMAIFTTSLALLNVLSINQNSLKK